LQRVINILFISVILTALYVLWTHTKVVNNILIIFVAALFVSTFFTPSQKTPGLTPKRFIYAIAYIFYLFIAIIRANLDVALRVVRPTIPLNPGIVSVKTELKSSIGKTVLANSITLTPGTLSVDISGDTLYIHWIDVKKKEEEGATEAIVKGFEKYLKVIFG